MGWGEPHGISAQLVRRNDERTHADLLANVVAAFLDARTSTNEERMRRALIDYREARTSATA